MDVPMKEFLLWSNCSNNCRFCWQKKLNKQETLLSEDEKAIAIHTVMDEIELLGYTDVLIVGGEVYAPHSDKVNETLRNLFHRLAHRVRLDMTRYVYVNTNLIYSDLVNIRSLLEEFKGYYDHLRFTTSYDTVGRFSTEEDRELFLTNVDTLVNEYPGIQIVANMILTRPLCEAVIDMDFSIVKFRKEHRLRFVNLIPYIPVSDNDPLSPAWDQIIRTLAMTCVEDPQFFEPYKTQLGTKVDRVLKEFRKNAGFVECGSKDADCGHNVNYTRAAKGECFLCKLNAAPIFKECTLDDVKEYSDKGYRIMTVGDRCSYEIWIGLRRPDVIVIDGHDSANDYSDALKKIREENIERTITRYHPSTVRSDNLVSILRSVMNEQAVIQNLYEEDDFVSYLIALAPLDTVVISGDGVNNCMRYTVVQN